MHQFDEPFGYFPTEEQRTALAFLDSLYPVQRDKDLRDALTGCLAEAIRLAILTIEDPPDVYVMDPAHSDSFDVGSGFQINGVSLEPGVPNLRSVLDAVRTKLKNHLTDSAAFCKRFTALTLTYRTDPDDPQSVVHPRLVDCLHGEIEHEDRTYFRLDKQWYGSSGDYLENLRQDFLHEVFLQQDPILIPNSELTFLDWNGGNENSFNRAQSGQPDFYFGDGIFAATKSGQVELFDLLKVDHDSRKTYIIHTKKSFGASTRDACSQIMMSADVMSADLRNGKELLTRHYRDKWSDHELNREVDETKFLSWFDYDLVYVVLCSTARNFTADDFTKNRLRSHIARRDVLLASKHIGGSAFRLAHTRSTR